MFALFTAAGAAAAMYFFDPESGERRRALLRDKVAWLKDEFGDVRETAEGRMEHVRNVAKGLAHETGIMSMMPKSPDTHETPEAHQGNQGHQVHESPQLHEASTTSHPQQEHSQPTNRAA